MRITKVGPILKVDDVEKAMGYWVDRLGFKPVIRVENDGCVSYGSVVLDDHEVHFGGEGTPDVSSRVYMWVDGIDELYKAWADNGAALGDPPVVDHWGGKIFTAFDNNGHEIQVLERA